MSYKLPQNAIPFDWEKYKSGKFEAITRGGYKPKQVYNLEGAKQPIVFVDNGNDVSFCFKDGKWSRQKECSIYDLFLRPKTVKKWHPVFKGMLCNSEHECLINWDVPNNSLVKAVEVEVNEE